MTTQPGWYPDPGREGRQRYHDGVDWTEHVLPQRVEPANALVSRPLSIEQRSERLDAYLIEVVQRGWRIEYRTPTQALVERGQHISTGMHAFHFILTLLTFGVWGLVWILHAMSRFERRIVISVDDEGNVSESRMKLR
jgi:hypothetical protein